eukprot:s2450_g9.t1
MPELSVKAPLSGKPNSQLRVSGQPGATPIPSLLLSYCPLSYYFTLFHFRSVKRFVVTWYHLGVPRPSASTARRSSRVAAGSFST